MKRHITGALAALSLLVAGTVSWAEEWSPPGPIKLMIAFAAGGGADTQARLIAEGIEASKGWKIIPEQVTGKGGLNAVKAVAQEPGDGTAIAMVVTESLGYNLRAADAGAPDQVTPITTTAGTQMGIVALASTGWKTLDDAIAAAKDGQAIRFGVMSPMLADLAYVIGRENGVEFNIIQVRGGRAVMNGVQAGDMDIGFAAGIQASGVAAGDVVNLASARSEPLAMSPDAPLLSDYGVPYVNETSFLLVGPPNMDPEAREAIADAVEEVLTDESTKANAMVTKAFGGPEIIRGDELVELIEKGYEEAGALLEDSAE